MSKLKIVTLSHAAGASGMYFFTGSSIFSLPRSSKRKILADVNCLVMEPNRNFVVGELGMFHSRFANPYPLSSSIVWSRAASTEPMNCLLET